MLYSIYYFHIMLIARYNLYVEKCLPLAQAKKNRAEIWFESQPSVAFMAALNVSHSDPQFVLSRMKVSMVMLSKSQWGKLNVFYLDTNLTKQLKHKSKFQARSRKIYPLQYSDHPVKVWQKFPHSCFLNSTQKKQCFQCPANALGCSSTGQLTLKVGQPHITQLYTASLEMF